MAVWDRIRRRLPIGGWLLVKGCDAERTQRAAVYKATGKQEFHCGQWRVVDRVLREVVWPETMRGHKY